jgi:RsiW-degrading membrane proteinase PrsW (M82 family)
MNMNHLRRLSIPQLLFDILTILVAGSAGLWAFPKFLYESRPVTVMLGTALIGLFILLCIEVRELRNRFF